MSNSNTSFPDGPAPRGVTRWEVIGGVLLGSGRRLLENLREPGPQFRIERVLAGPAVTHVRNARRSAA